MQYVFGQYYSQRTFWKLKYILKDPDVDFPMGKQLSGCGYVSAAAKGANLGSRQQDGVAGDMHETPAAPGEGCEAGTPFPSPAQPAQALPVPAVWQGLQPPLQMEPPAAQPQGREAFPVSIVQSAPELELRPDAPSGQAQRRASLLVRAVRGTLWPQLMTTRAPARPHGRAALPLQSAAGVSVLPSVWSSTGASTMARGPTRAGIVLSVSASAPTSFRTGGSTWARSPASGGIARGASAGARASSRTRARTRVSVQVAGDGCDKSLSRCSRTAGSTWARSPKAAAWAAGASGRRPASSRTRSCMGRTGGWGVSAMPPRNVGSPREHQTADPWVLGSPGNDLGAEGMAQEHDRRYRSSLDISVLEAIDDGIEDGGDYSIEEGDKRVSDGIIAGLRADVDKDRSAIEEGDHARWEEQVEKALGRPAADGIRKIVARILP
eukprot:bmy_18659T0